MQNPHFTIDRRLDNGLQITAHIEHEGAVEWFNVTINVNRLVSELGLKALGNKSKSATEAGGAIKVEVTT